MSYINEALHKVQKEKESPYAPYGDLVSAAGKKPDHRRKWFSAVGLAIVFFYAAGMIVWLYWPEISKKPRAAAVVQAPMMATLRPAPDGAIQGAPAAGVPVTAAPIPAAVEKTPAADFALSAAVKEKKPNGIMPARPMRQDALPSPAGADTGILYAQALQKQNKGELAEAKILYQKVIQTDPRHVSALNNLGVIFMNQKMYQQAVASFNEALRIRRDYVDAHYNLACLYAQNNDTKKSLFYLKNAIGFNPQVRQWAAGDDDLKVLADLPEFNKLLQARDE